jgi:hypothetical protein
MPSFLNISTRPCIAALPTGLGASGKVGGVGTLNTLIPSSFTSGVSSFFSSAF